MTPVGNGDARLGALETESASVTAAGVSSEGGAVGIEDSAQRRRVD